MNWRFVDESRELLEAKVLDSQVREAIFGNGRAHHRTAKERYRYVSVGE